MGPEEHQATYTVHAGVICEQAEFFRNALKKEWASMREKPGVIELPDNDPDAFGLYMQWLYSKQISILADLSDEPEDDEKFHTLAYAYVLGEKIIDNDFKNAIMDAYVLYARAQGPSKRYYPSNEEIRILYEGTRESSPIRQFLVDVWTWRGKHSWLEHDSDLPKDFLVEVAKGLFKVRPSVEYMSRPWKNSHEQYHDH